jgi:long-subunit fatty acid transport protein
MPPASKQRATRQTRGKKSTADDADDANDANALPATGAAPKPTTLRAQLNATQAEMAILQGK